LIDSVILITEWCISTSAVTWSFQWFREDYQSFHCTVHHTEALWNPSFTTISMARDHGKNSEKKKYI